ncbi:23472_t:CDS:2, partial [Cetraspora pellucida]
QYREPLPDSKQMLQTVSRYKYYITMDIKSAYWQLVMHENSKKYIATTFTEYGTYCWHTLPFGISTAPAYLIRAMNKILGHLDYVVIYMDDFVILLNDKSEAQIKLTETIIWKNWENVLKIKEVDKFTTPKNKTELQRFLGFMNYFRSFILDFARVATPLYGLVGTAEFNWTDDCQKAMEELKQ